MGLGSDRKEDKGNFGGDLEVRDILEVGALGRPSSTRMDLRGRPWKECPDHPKGGQESLAGETESQKSGHPALFSATRWTQADQATLLTDVNGKSKIP